MNQAVGLRQEEIQVLPTQRERERITLRWKGAAQMEQRVCCACRWAALTDRGVLPREHPGVLAQVQVQQRVGVLVAGAQSLRERHHSWETGRGVVGRIQARWADGEIKGMQGNKERGRQGGLYNMKRQRTLSNILCAYIIHTHLQQISVGVMWSGAKHQPGLM